MERRRRQFVRHADMSDATGRGPPYRKESVAGTAFLDGSRAAAWLEVWGIGGFWSVPSGTEGHRANVVALNPTEEIPVQAPLSFCKDMATMARRWNRRSPCGPFALAAGKAMCRLTPTEQLGSRDRSVSFGSSDVARGESVISPRGCWVNVSEPASAPSGAFNVKWPRVCSSLNRLRPCSPRTQMPQLCLLVVYHTVTGTAFVRQVPR